MRSKGVRRGQAVIGRRASRGIAAVALAATLAATGCARSGGDRIPEARGGPGQQAAAAPRTTASGAPGGTATPTAPDGTPSASPTTVETAVPEGDAFFDPPTPLPSEKPGSLVRQRPFTVPDAGLPGGAREVVVMYTTTGTDGRPIAATGLVTLPNGPAPEGGWPVMAWDHGTMGIGTECAPSRGFLAGLDSGNEMLSGLLERGFAVVRPDYIGMGATGVKHPYLHGQSAAYATIDLVRAARAVDPGVGSTWFVSGHSQGAHAALWTSHYAPAYSPELTLKGVIALAPGTGFHLMPGLVAQRDATSAPYIGIFLMLVNGASAADPAVEPAELLTPDALAVADRAWTECLSTVTSGEMPDPANVLKPDADLGPLTAVLQASATDQVNPSAPVFLAQGSLDPLAPLNLPMSQTLCAKGASLEYKLYPEQGHDLGGFRPSASEALAWIQDRMNDVPITGACTF